MTWIDDLILPTIVSGLVMIWHRVACAHMWIVQSIKVIIRLMVIIVRHVVFRVMMASMRLLEVTLLIVISNSILLLSRDTVSLGLLRALWLILLEHACKVIIIWILFGLRFGLLLWLLFGGLLLYRALWLLLAYCEWVLGGRWHGLLPLDILNRRPVIMLISLVRRGINVRSVSWHEDVHPHSLVTEMLWVIHSDVFVVDRAAMHWNHLMVWLTYVVFRCEMTWSEMSLTHVGHSIYVLTLVLPVLSLVMSAILIFETEATIEEAFYLRMIVIIVDRLN